MVKPNPYPGIKNTEWFKWILGWSTTMPQQAVCLLGHRACTTNLGFEARHGAKREQTCLNGMFVAGRPQ